MYVRVPIEFVTDRAYTVELLTYNLFSGSFRPCLVTASDLVHVSCMSSYFGLEFGFGSEKVKGPSSPSRASESSCFVSELLGLSRGMSLTAFLLQPEKVRVWN
jgi:hypothetical protein